MSIQIRKITKTFGKFMAFDDVNFSVEGGELAPTQWIGRDPTLASHRWA
jgi:ABC-type uncharacterized transport system ATPase subunit